MTDYRKKIYHYRKPYDMEKTSNWFVEGMKAAVKFHRENSDWYRAFTDAVGFDESQINSEEDLAKIPPVPTMYFKRNHSFSVPEKDLKFAAKSSGTSGMQSVIGFDKKAFRCEIAMAINLFRYYKGFSIRPTGYIVLGYSIEDSDGRGVGQTMTYGTKFAPAYHVEYALKKENGEFKINEEGVMKWLTKYVKLGLPIRFVGFPPFLYVLLSELEKRGISLKLNKRSRVILGGGWKAFGIGEVSHEEMSRLLKSVMGIEGTQVNEIYSTVESPLPYVRCCEGHFHTNIYSRPIVRDAETLEPLEYGKKGLLSLISPVMYGMPLNSVLTDDIATLHAPGTCTCGCRTSWFELHGRAGAKGVKTCSAEAGELAGGKA